MREKVREKGETEGYRAGSKEMLLLVPTGRRQRVLGLFHGVHPVLIQPLLAKLPRDYTDHAEQQPITRQSLA